MKENQDIPDSSEQKMGSVLISEQAPEKFRCRCRGHGAPEIIDPCIRELVDCLNRHGVKTLQSCCGHGGEGEIILAPGTVEPHIRKESGWTLKLAPKPVTLSYCDDTTEWKDEYPTGGRNWFDYLTRMEEVARQLHQAMLKIVE